MNYNQHLLIALPDMPDERFKKAVILVCEDNEEGTMGLVLNHPLDIAMSQVFSDLNMPAPFDTPCPLSNGGPLGNNHGFVLHNDDSTYSSSIHISDQLTLTTSRDLLQDISEDRYSHKWQLILGYSAWSKGQLDSEILHNSWLTCALDLDLVFNTPYEQQWEKALSLIGIKDYRTLTGGYGHA